MIGSEGQRVYTAPPGKEKALPGNIPLFSGYAANEQGHGELADLHTLAAFLDSPPVGSVADGFFPRQGVKAKELAAHIAAVYQEAGVAALHVEPVGEVLLDRKGILNSIGHFSQNKKTTPEHKQRVTDAFALVPAVLQKGALVEYGQQVDNKNLHSYIYLAPVQIGKEKCVMAVRIRSAQGQRARFYLHGVTKIDTLKEKSRGCRDQGSGLDTGTPSGADPRDAFRIAKKASGVKLKEKAPKMGRIRGSGLGTGTPSGADHRDVFRVAKKAYAVKQKKENIHAANPYGCNQYQHPLGCPHEGGGVDPELGQNLEAALRRARNADGTVSRDGELSRNHEVRLRSMPEALKLLGEPDVPLVMTVYHIRKLHKSHCLSVEQLREVAAKLNDPLLVMQADVQKYLVLLDMEAYEEQDKAMRPVICFVEKKPSKTHAEYVVSAYPLQKEKYRKVTGQVKSLLYSKFRDEKTAQFAADAPQYSEARDLLRAAIRSGFTKNIPTREDVVKRKNDIEMQAARRSISSSGALLAELTMREYLRPLAADLKEAKKRGESYADIKKRLAAPLTNAAALAHGLAAAFNAGRFLPQADEDTALAEHCNQYKHIPGCKHEGGKQAHGSWDTETFTKEEKQKAIYEFAKTRKAKTEELYKKIGGKVETPIPSIPEVNVSKSGVKEMLNNKALWSSMSLGASIETHIEAVERTRELVKTSKPGKPIPTTASDDPVKEKIYLDKQFTAKDGNSYTARYMVRMFKQTGMQPDIYFMNCRK